MIALSLLLAATAATTSLRPIHGPAEPTIPGQGIDVVAYSVSITPDFTAQSLTGTQSITLKANAPIRDILFSPNALTVRDAKVGNQPVMVDSLPNAIRFRLPYYLKQGQQITLRFSLSGKPKRGWIATPSAITTSYFACDWMVCLQDSPGDKALLNLDLWLAPGMASVAQGNSAPLVARGGLELHRWRGTTAYSPYIYGFAAGQLTHAEERVGRNRLSYYGTANQTPDQLKLLFSPTPAMVAFFEEKAGMPLPQNRYAQIAVTGDEAQETTAFSVIGSEYLEERLASPQEDWAIAHELAHQWWGNSVTSENWQHFWLNEGLVTFMTAAWKEKAHGRAAYDAEMALARRRWDSAREKGWDRPLAFSGKYPDLGTRRAIQYSKGALFFDALRRELGDDIFWRGIRLYTRSHWDGTVTSRDLEAAMVKAASTTSVRASNAPPSRKNLSALFSTWVYDSISR